MKKYLLFVFAILFVAVSAEADILLHEDFEDATVSYTTSVPEFTDGSGDFFIRTDGSDHGSFVNYNNVQGSSYFAGMDLNGEGATLPLYMEFTGINITGYTDINFSGLFAEDDDSDDEDWDLPDYVHIEYQIDNGGYQNLLWFESIPDGDQYNAVPAVDTDFDGNGDGTILTDTFSLFSAGITETGELLDIRFTFDLDSGDEDIAFDDIKIDASAVPVPAAIWLLGSGLMALVGVRRKTR